MATIPHAPNATKRQGSSAENDAVLSPQSSVLIDTHAHLDDGAFDPDRAAVIARAREAGIRAIVNVGFDPARWASTAALCAAHEDIYAVLGLHPHEAGAWDEALARRLRAALAGPKVVGLGEIGLDFYRNHAPHEAQRAAFRAQLALARELALPVVLHSRAAEGDVVAMLAAEEIGRGVLHSFSGTVEEARRALALGVHISLTGPVSFPKAEALRDLARAIPLDRLLLETDCPYLAPQPRRGRRNEPAFLRFTAEAIAAARDEPVERIIAATGANARALFGLPVGKPVGEGVGAGGGTIGGHADTLAAPAALYEGDTAERPVRTMVLATTNPGKVREFRALLAGLPVRVAGLDEVGLVAPPETGATFAENAALKARHAAAGSGLLAVADDSGLEVDALGGAPGVHSARWAGEGAGDEANRRRLIRELAGVPEGARGARFRCAIAIAAPGGAIEIVEGECEGRVVTEPRGEGGFGYDPLFLLPERGLTMAELAPAEKNAISHRARAFARALPILRTFLAATVTRRPRHTGGEGEA